MADIIRIGLELDASALMRGGAEAERVLAKLKAGSKLTADEVKALNAALTATGTAGGQAVVGVNALNPAFLRTQTQARATTQVFNQLRGGMASMAQAAIGQTVPGLAAVTSQLGTLAFGSPALVAALAGLAAVATAFRLITKDAREANKELKESATRLDALGMDEATRIQLDVDRARSRQQAIAPEMQRLIDMGLAPGSNKRLNQLVQEYADLGRQIFKGEAALQDIRDKAEAERERDADAARAKELREIKEWFDEQNRIIIRANEVRRQAAIAAGVAAGAVFGAGSGPTGPGPGALGVVGRFANIGVLGSGAGGDTDPDKFKVNFEKIVTGLTTAGVTAFLSVIDDFVVGLFKSSAAAEKASSEWLRSIDQMIAGLDASLTGRQRAEADAIRRVQEQGRGAGLDLQGPIGFGLEASGFESLQHLAESIQRIMELVKAGSPEWEKWQKLLQLTQAELAALIHTTEVANERTRESLNMRLLTVQGMEKEALALRQKLEAEQFIRDGADEATLALLGLVQGLERLSFEAEQRAKGLAFAADLAERQAKLAGDDIGALRIRMEYQAAQELAAAQKLLDAGIITQEMFQGLAAVLGGELAQAIEKAQKAAEDAARSFGDQVTTDYLVATGQGQAAAEFNLSRSQEKRLEEANELIAKGLLPASVRDQLKVIFAAEWDKLRQQFAAAGLIDVGAATIGSRRSGSTTQSITTITETTALTLAHLQRGILTQSNKQSFLLEKIERNTRGSGGTSTVTVNGNVTTGGAGTGGGSGILGSEVIDGINTGLGRISRREQRRTGDATV